MATDTQAIITMYPDYEIARNLAVRLSSGLLLGTVRRLLCDAYCRWNAPVL